MTALGNFPRLHSCYHGTALFTDVCTVAEPALSQIGLELRKAVCNAFLAVSNLDQIFFVVSTVCTATPLRAPSMFSLDAVNFLLAKSNVYVPSTSVLPLCALVIETFTILLQNYHIGRRSLYSRDLFRYLHL